MQCSERSSSIKAQLSTCHVPKDAYVGRRERVRTLERACSVRAWHHKPLDIFERWRA